MYINAYDANGFNGAIGGYYFPHIVQTVNSLGTFFIWWGLCFVDVILCIEATLKYLPNPKEAMQENTVKTNKDVQFLCVFFFPRVSVSCFSNVQSLQAK